MRKPADLNRFTSDELVALAAELEAGAAGALGWPFDDPVEPAGAKAAGVDLADTVVIGDQRNDMAMFARAGLSIAMAQGPQDVRDAADRAGAAGPADTAAAATAGIGIAAESPATAVTAAATTAIRRRHPVRMREVP